MRIRFGFSVDLDLSTEDQAFREEARTWLEENKPEATRPGDPVDARPFDLAWQRTQYDGGWAGIAWPTEYGGRDLPLLRQLIWYEELARSGAPDAGVCFVGLNHGGPTLIAVGTEEQKQQFLPGILKGEEVWCQGFSEPEAGSDLASLRTKAILDGDNFVVTGQKIWTSYAHVADFQELLVRTNPDLPKHRGLTWMICDMRAPGIDIRPIRNITGEADFCEVFYDAVRVPIERVVGGVDQGWSTAMATLSFERGTAFMADILRLGSKVERLILVAKQTPAWNGRGTAWSDDAVRVELARLRVEGAALRSFNLAMVSRIAQDGVPGAESSMVRFYYAQLTQKVFDTSLRVLGQRNVAANADESTWIGGYFNSFRNVIAGGTKDIQRNIIGERVLGLPKHRS
jgi:alkylation response protein AidB-like acyl-CoA dehydrogenase